MKSITQAELSQHSKPGDMWLAIDGDVYNVSKFASVHPGGSKVLEHLAGNDVTQEFYDLHRQDVLTKYGRLRVGRLATGEATGAAVQESTPSQRGPNISEVPYSEFPAFQGQQSPYFKDSHLNFLRDVRAFVQKELAPIAAQADLEGEYCDRELQQKLGMNGLMVTRMGPGPWLKEAVKAGITIPGGVTPEEFDYFHEMIAHQEIARLGTPGFIDGIGTGWMISAPAVYNFGSQAMKETVGKQLLRGDKWSCLAISEPFAGSDVAALRATAVKTPDGKHYIVNGVKKWITEGQYADYFVTAVRTGKGGGGGISVVLIERGEGLSTSQIKTTYSTCAGTALVVLNDCKVPVENLLGKENDGFKLIMYNFNHERWLIVQNLLGQARAALADTFMWAKQRKIFGKLLIDQPVIRNKLASAVAAMESVHAFNEALTYDMCKTKGGAVGQRLAGPIALLKYQATRTAWKVTDDTVQILGGRGITRTGMGAKIAGLKNYATFAAVYGGIEEIMADLAIKQALKVYPSTAKL
jgi:alkylation response protein AidB-like acyl-CoA dehydrogenase/predicted heme/steroid binding protein